MRRTQPITMGPNICLLGWLNKKNILVIFILSNVKINFLVKTGYKDIKLDQFEGSYQPSKTLLKYWLESSNGSEMGTEMLLASLKELRRFDVIDVINDSEGKLIKLSRLAKKLTFAKLEF